MTIYLALAIAVATLVAAFFLFRYHPLRKWINIKTDPSWSRLARLYVFDEADEKKEEQRLFISATVIRDGCDYIWHEEAEDPPAELFTALPPGSSVHVNAKRVRAFAERIVPHLVNPIVLVSGYETYGPSEGDKAILASDKIIHWFAQNYDIDDRYRREGRVTPIPVGLNYHKLEPNGINTSIDMGLPASHGNQQLTLRHIAAGLPPLRERPLRVYANFHLNMDTFLRDPLAKLRADARREARDILRDMPFVEFEHRQIPRNEVWRRHRHFSFEASPRGNGLDCHRTWEALFLGTVPIVKTSTLDPLYAPFPIAIVEDWHEVTVERLEQWREQYADALAEPYPPALYSDYWLGLIREAGERYRRERGGNAA